ncbi:MAG TPA: hypothetical protein VMU85_11630 [Stellaceae bacterium]|nr:hypothetical protein [Stellaceae bacterium]
MRLVMPMLAAALALGACSDRSEPPPAGVPTAVPRGTSGSAGACSERARALGFIVQGEEPAYRDAYGNTVVPVLVIWGNGAVDIDCHIDRQGGITIE